MPGDKTPAHGLRPSTVTVCMATYNGERYLAAQLESILRQLREDDEIVIVDDASSDDSMRILDALDDPRVSVFRNDENQGYVRTFERAMSLATRDVLLLSDQDDLWVEGRRDALVDAAGNGDVIASNLVLLGSEEPLTSPLNGRPWLLSASDDGRPLRNELRILAGDAPYFGCAMAVRRDALGLVLPFPSYLYESHDLWIATVANVAGTLRHLEKATVRRRVHDDNASSARPRGVGRALRSRLLLLRLWHEARRRLKAMA